MEIMFPSISKIYSREASNSVSISEIIRNEFVNNNNKMPILINILSTPLGDAVLQVLNQNWRMVVEDFGKPFLDYAVGYSINTMKKLFRVVPYNELIYVPIPL